MKEPFPPYAYSIPADSLNIASAEGALAQIFLSEPVKRLGHRMWSPVRRDHQTVVFACDTCGVKVKVYQNSEDDFDMLFTGRRWVAWGDGVAVPCIKSAKDSVENTPTGRLAAMKGDE